MIARTTWTQQQDEIMLQMIKDGASYGDIAKAIGKSKNSVLGRANRTKMNLQHPKAVEFSRRGNGKGRVDRKEHVYVMRNPAPVSLVRRTIQSAPPVDPPRRHLGITFADLDRHHCRYPLGEGEAMTFCGQQKMPDKSYCPHCYKITRRFE